jgi:hypothetical protein
MPPLQRQLLEINVAKGMNQGIDRRVLPADQWARLVNVVVDKQGAAHNRPGYGLMSQTVLSPGGATFPQTATWTDTRLDELLIRGKDPISKLERIYSFSPAISAWKDVDYATTVAHESTNVSTLTSGAVLPRVCVSADGIETWMWAKGSSVEGPVYLTRDTLTKAVLHVEADAGYAWTIQKILSIGHHAMFLGSLSGHGFEFVSYDPRTGADLPNAPGTLAASLFSFELWDACEVDAARFAAVHVGPLDTDITISTYDVTGTVVQGRTLHAGAVVKRVSIAAVAGVGFRVVFALASNDIYMAGFSDAPGIPLLWTTTSLDTPAAVAYVAAGMRDTGDGVAVWQESIANTPGPTPLFAQDVTPGGTFNFLLRLATANTILRSKPFAVNDGFYAVCSPYVTGTFFTLNLLRYTALTIGNRTMGCEGIFGEGAAYLAQQEIVSIENAPLFAEVPSTGLHSRLYAAELRNPPLLDLNTANSYVVGTELDFETQSASPRGVAAQACIARSGSQVSWYDGESEVELSFTQRPRVSAVATGAGNVDAGAHIYQAVYEWIDGQGNKHVSEPSDPFSVTLVGASTVTVTATTLGTTRKGRASQGEQRHVQVAFFRTTVNGEILYRITPPNQGVTSDPTVVTVSFVDNVSDVNVVGEAFGQIYTSGEILPNGTLPGVRCVESFGSRLWAASAEDGKTIYFSKSFVVNEAPAFSDGLTLRVDDAPDSIVAMAALDDKLIVFTGERIYYVSGDGPNDTGLGGSFNGPNRVAADAGCVDARSVVSVPGGVFYASPAGIYHLDRALEVTPKGLPVLDETTGCTYLGTVLDSVEKRVLFLVTGGTDAVYAGPRVLVYDYAFDIWTIWIPYTQDRSDPTTTIPDDTLRSQAVWLGYHVWTTNGLSEADVWQQGTGPTPWLDGEWFFPAQYESPWVHVAGIAGFQRTYRVTATGAQFSNHAIQMDVLCDYDESTVYQSRAWDASSLVGAPALERMQLHLRPQLAAAIKIRLASTAVAGDPSGAGPIGGFDLAALTFEIGVKPNSARLPPQNRG